MNTVDELVRSLFQKESLNDCSLEELHAIATQYPYFTPVQLLLADKIKVIERSSLQRKSSNTFPAF